MQAPSKKKLSDLQKIISKMPLEFCCLTAVPEFGLSWADVSQAVRKARLPMTPTSVASMLCKYASKMMAADEVAQVVSQLRLKAVATGRSTWHMIMLTDQIVDQPANHAARSLPSNVKRFLKVTIKDPRKRAEVHTVKLGELLFISVQIIIDNKEGSVLYVATPPGQPFAAVSSPSSNLIKPCVLGLGYKNFENMSLSGIDTRSLVRIYNGNNNMAVDVPDYVLAPTITTGGVDFTGRKVDMAYVRSVLGPDPPHLDSLKVTALKNFFDPTILNKKTKILFHLKSDNVAQTLESWAEKGAILPTSDLFQIFNKIKSNNLHTYDDDE